MPIFIKRLLIKCLLVSTFTFLPFASFALEVNIEAGEDVPQSLVQDAYNGVTYIEKFYKDMYGLDINYPIRLYLVSGKERYIEALNNELGISKEQAEKYYYNTAGITNGHTIVSDIRAFGGTRGLLEHIAHEITHQYQRSLCGTKNQQIKWLSEGSADVLAVSILAINGRGSVNTMARERMAALKAVPRVPELSTMHDGESWMKSCNTTGQGVSYYTSDMAVIFLISKVGYEPIFTYFQLLGETSVKEAFSKAFGISIEDFEAEFHDYLIENGVTI